MPKLIINPTSGAKKEIPVGERVVSIGRDPSNDLVLTDAMVSRRHAIMELREGQYVLRDNNSSNGTLVNGDRIVGDKALRDGDLISIGTARILFQADQEVVGPGSTPSPPPAAERVEPVEVQAELSACPACGAETTASDRHCRRCGKELPGRSPHQVICRSCKAAVALPARYCGNCGQALVDESQSWNNQDLRGKPSTAPVRRDLKPTVSAVVTPSKRAGPSRPPARRPATSPMGSQDTPAGFWIRLVAYCIDSLIVALPALSTVVISTLLLLSPSRQSPNVDPFPLKFVLPAAGGFLTFILSIVYFLYFWAVRSATPGKQLLRLKILTEEGASPIGTRRALLRLLGYVINSFTLGIGFLLIAFSTDKRGLHDRFAETRVVRCQE